VAWKLFYLKSRDTNTNTLINKEDKKRDIQWHFSLKQVNSDIFLYQNRQRHTYMIEYLLIGAQGASSHILALEE